MIYTLRNTLGNRVGSFDTKAISEAWSRFEKASVVAINAAHRRFTVLAPRVWRVIASTKAYWIGIPLTLAIPVAGVFLGLKLAHDPRFASAKSPLVEAGVSASFFLLTAFFTGVRWIGLLGTIAVAGFLLLAIFLLCARLVGANVITVFRRPRKPREHPPSSEHKEQAGDDQVSGPQPRDV